MPLVFSPAKKIWWPVTFYPPGEAGDGRTQKVTSKFLWELASTDLLQAQNISEEERAELLRAELIEKMHDWDIETPDHEKIMCTPEAVEDIMREPWIASRLMEEWLACSLGGGAKKKSSGLRRNSS